MRSIRLRLYDLPHDQWIATYSRRPTFFRFYFSERACGCLMFDCRLRQPQKAWCWLSGFESLSVARNGAVIRKTGECLALQVAVLEAAVGVEVRVLREDHGHRSVNSVVLERIIEVHHAAYGLVAPDRGQV